MRRRLTVALLALMAINIGGCADMATLKTDAAIAEQGLSFLETELGTLKADLEELEDNGDETAGVLADRVSDFELKIAEYKPYLEQLDTTITNAEDSADVGIGLLEWGMSLAGLGGIGGVVGNRLRRAKEAAERKALTNALTQGQTSVDRRTLAMLPADIAEALRTNGAETD